MSTTDSAQDRRQLAGTRWRLNPSGSTAEFRVPFMWHQRDCVGLAPSSACDIPASTSDLQTKNPVKRPGSAHTRTHPGTAPDEIPQIPASLCDPGCPGLSIRSSHQC
jgi:hypothetical protein